jgi:protein archease
MSYRWVEHTAEVELHIEAASERGIFESALQALAELIDEQCSGERVRREVAVGAPDRGALLAAWIEELVYIAETDDLVPEQLEDLELTDGHLRASVRAHRGRPRHLVKGVTYHRLAFEGADGRFAAQVVLDV